MRTGIGDGGRLAIKVSLLSAAVGAGFAGSAEAAFISTAVGVPATFTISGPSSSLPIDLNADGTADVTVTSTQGSGISIDAGLNRVSSFAGFANAFASTADFLDPNKPVAFGGLKSSTGIVPVATLSGGNVLRAFGSSPGDLEIVFSGAGNQFVGYIASSLTVTGAAGAQDATFVITDFGFNPAPLPEPSSLALLAAGAVGLGVLRRRRAQRPA